MQDGFFLRKKPFQGITFPLHQLESSYKSSHNNLELRSLICSCQKK